MEVLKYHLLIEKGNNIMRGYNSSVRTRSDAYSARGQDHDTTYFVFRGPRKDITNSDTLWSKMMLHPRDIEALNVRVSDMWTFMPWKPWPGVSEEEKRAREGTVALIRTESRGRRGHVTRMRLNAGGSGRLEQAIEKGWLEQFVLGNMAEQFFDALAKYSVVHLLPRMSVEQEEDESALIIGPDISIFVPTCARDNYDRSVRRAEAAQANSNADDSIATTGAVSGNSNVDKTSNEEWIFVEPLLVEASATVLDTKKVDSIGANRCGDQKDQGSQHSDTEDDLVFVEGGVIIDGEKLIT